MLSLQQQSLQQTLTFLTKQASLHVLKKKHLEEKTSFAEKRPLLVRKQQTKMIRNGCRQATHKAHVSHSLSRICGGYATIATDAATRSSFCPSRRSHGVPDLRKHFELKSSAHRHDEDRYKNYWDSSGCGTGTLLLALLSLTLLLDM